ncbi:3-keto-disaccharide hydrolase [Rubritalea profundi]|nr:DUF1080 domain-containing protein [Rubritalea profundi]
MKLTTSMLSAALFGAAFASTPLVFAEQPVLITEEEQVIGWKPLFDGKTLKGIDSWKSRKALEAGGWSVKDGVLTLAAKSGGGDIYFPASLAENYELELEWNTKGNSGVFLRVDPSGKGAIWANALEMQVINDTANDRGTHSAGALYDFIGMRKGRKVLNEDGWNKVKIICRNSEFTHYLNGKELYRYTVGDETWFDKRLPKSKFKNNKDYGMLQKGVIGLQDHGDEVSYRNIKFRELTGADAANEAQKFRKKIFSKRGPVIGNVLSGNDDAYDVNCAYYVNLLDDSTNVGAVFNADTFQLAGAWTNGGGAGFHGLPYQGGHGATPSWNEKLALFAAKNQPGWANADGSFSDPRASDGQLPNLGSLPKDWAKFNGYYVADGKVVFSYSVGEASVLDSPDAVQIDATKVIVRQLELSKLSKAKELYIADSKGEVAVDASGTIAKVNGTTFVASAGAKFSAKDGAIYLTISANKSEKSITLAVWTGKTAPAEVIAAVSKFAPLSASIKGGKPRYSTEKPIVTTGKVSTKKAPYVTDKITLPHDNPFGLKIRVGGFDFFEGGKSLAFSTWDGDLWKVTGIDEKLEKLEYQLIATGLHETLGLTIVDNTIYTVGNDQITKHHDLNGDGETDFFETFNNDWKINKGFHIFSFDLKTDAEGNFWFAQGSPVRSGGRGFERISPTNGSIFKVSKEGSTLEQFASGFRSPNGIGVGPNGEITAGDNEGSFMPRCPIHWVTKDYFGGVVDTYAQKEKLKSSIWGAKPEVNDVSEMAKPLMWLPMDVDNSGGSQVWTTDERFGMPKDQLLHCSYGKSSVYRVFHETVNGQVQGGVTKVPFPALTSSALRARFNPADGQLFIGGLKGWQTNAAELGGIDRIRFTGAQHNTVTLVQAKEKGLLVHFNFELDGELAGDPESYSIKAANIKWSEVYGSKEYLIDDATKQGWSKLAVTAAKLQEDKKSVFLSIDNMQPMHELKLDVDVETKDLDEAIFPVWMTIHELGK